MKAIKIKVEVIGEWGLAIKEAIIIAKASKEPVSLYFPSVGKHGISISVSAQSSWNDLYWLYEALKQREELKSFDAVKKVISKRIEMHKTNAQDLNSSDSCMSRNQSQWEVLQDVLDQIDKIII